MLIKSKTYFCTIFIFALLPSCQSRPSITATEQVVSDETSSVSEANKEVRIITSEIPVVDFGWTGTNHDIYYGVGGDPTIDSGQPITDRNETVWYGYQGESKIPERMENPYPHLDNGKLNYLKRGQIDTILTMLVAPSENKVLYTKLPHGYERPQPLPFDYMDPTETWIAENLIGELDERIMRPLLDSQDQLYDCGLGLSTEGRWLYDETLVFGSCYFPYGITRVYFLADILEKKVQFLNFKDETEEYVPTEVIVMANQSPSLAFSTNGAFWVVPLEDGAREVPLKLTELNFVLNDQPVVAPIWSADDQWIYYWTFGEPTQYDRDGFVEYQPWWLEKINLMTREHVVVLNESDLLSLLGLDLYRRGTPLGFGNPWKLSVDEKSLLMFLPETVDTESTLFLLSWP